MKRLTKEQIEKKKEQQRIKKEKEKLRLEAEAKKKEEEAEETEREGMRRAEEEAEAMIRKEKALKDEEGRLSVERGEASAENARAEEKLARWVERKRGQAEWRHFLEHTRRVDAANAAEVNAFVATWRETPVLTLAQASDLATASSDIVGDLEALEAEAEQAGDLALAARFAESLAGLKEFVFSKFDESTAVLVAHSDMYIPQDSEVCVVQQEGEVASVGIWVTFGVSPTAVGNPGQVFFDRLGMGAVLPAFLAMKGTAMRMLRTTMPVHPTVASAQSRSIHDLKAVGGEILFDTLALPQAPKKVKTWTIRPIGPNSKTLVRVPFFTSSTQEAGAMTPVAVHFTVPTTVLVREPAVVGRWNEDSGTWEVSPGISGVCYDPGTRVVKFLTPTTGSFSLVHSMALDCPFDGWQLEPGADSCRAVLTIVTKSGLRVAIQVADDSCTLLEPDVPELAHLRKVSCSSLPFLRRLADSGISLIAPGVVGPADGLRPKEKHFEAEANTQISRAAGIATIRWSKWNSGIPVSAAAVTVLPRGHGQQFGALLVQGKGCAFGPSAEDDEKFVPGTTNHLDIRACIKSHLVGKGDGKVPQQQGAALFSKPPDLQFTRELATLLNLIRPLSFSR